MPIDEDTIRLSGCCFFTAEKMGQCSGVIIQYWFYYTLFLKGGTSILLFPRFPHKLSDGQLGLMLLVIIPVIFGLFWLYNAYRLGRLKWKPKGQANPRLVCLVILFIIIVSVVLLLVAEKSNSVCFCFFAKPTCIYIVQFIMEQQSIS